MSHSRSQSGSRSVPGLALPSVLVIVSALLILAVGLLLVVGTERGTARSFVDFQRADLAARAGLADFKGLFTAKAANDTYTILQATLAEPIQPGRTKAPFLFLAQGRKASNDAFSFSYTPLFSAAAVPPESAVIEAPEVVPLVGTEPAGYLDFSTRPWLDKVRVAWVPIHDEKGRMVARYAYWVEDLQGRLDPATAGNTSGDGGTHAGVTWPFPAPGLNPFPESAEQPGLDRIALYAVDPASSAGQPGPLAATLIGNRPILISPDAALAAAGVQPPLVRDAYGHLADPVARAAEESLATGFQPYDEQPRVPFAAGLAATVAGQPKLNLNALLAKGDPGVAEMADFIKKALPEFETRKGGFPDDYVKTIAANAIDYADADSESTLVAGSHRGLDAFPLLSEIMLHVHYLGMTTVNDRRIVNWEFRLFAELWNMTDKDVAGATRLSYEVALPMEPIGAATASKRFDDPSLLGNPDKATHQLVKLDGRYWTPEIAVSLKANEYKTYEFATVGYKIDVGPSGISVGSKVSLTEQMGAAGCSLRWNDQEVDRFAGIIRQKSGLEFTLSKPETKSKATVAALSLGPYTTVAEEFRNNPGDPRSTYYLRNPDYPSGENASPENTSPNRRNIRRSTIYDGDSSRKPKVYGRVLPSEWPDGGHDSPVGSWSISKDDAVVPIDPRYFWAQDPQPGQAPQRLSNLGRFYSATELGRIYDPLMWQPAYDTTWETSSIRRGLMPATRSSWPEVVFASPPSTDQGGGNTLRIGRPEHPAFDRPGKRTSQLLDLFHCGRPRSDQIALREGNLVRIDGHVNLNTASRDVLRALAAGPLGQDLLLATTSSSGVHQGVPLMAPATTKTTLYAPSTSLKTEADRIADAILLRRPFASPSEIAHLKDPDGKPVFGNPALYQADGQLKSNVRVQWTDAAAEEVFARVYEASTVRSRNFRVWVVGQALAPVAVGGTRPPEVLAESRRVFTLFVDPGTRAADGTIDPKQVRPTIINERTF